MEKKPDDSTLIETSLMPSIKSRTQFEIRVFLNGAPESFETSSIRACSNLDFKKISDMASLPNTAIVAQTFKSLLAKSMSPGCRILNKPGLRDFSLRMTISETSHIRGIEGLIYMELMVNMTRVEHSDKTVSLLFNLIVQDIYQVSRNDLISVLSKYPNEIDSSKTLMIVPGSPLSLVSGALKNYIVPAQLGEYSSVVTDRDTRKNILLAKISDMNADPVIDSFVRTVLKHNKTLCDLPTKEILHEWTKKNSYANCILVSPNNHIVVIGSDPESHFNVPKWDKERFRLGIKNFGFIKMGGTPDSIQKALFHNNLKTLLGNTDLTLTGSRLRTKDYSWDSPTLMSKLVCKKLMGEGRS